MTWNETTIAQLKELWAAGYSTQEIGRRMGLSKNAIVGKSHRLELDARPSPIIRTGVQAPAKTQAVRKEPTLPPLSSASGPTPARKSMIVADIRQPALPIKPPAVVTWLRSIRTGCEWLDGERGDYRKCGEPVVRPGCSWCASHYVTVFVRRSAAGEAAD